MDRKLFVKILFSFGPKLFLDDGRVKGGLNLSRAFGDHMYKDNDKLNLKDQMITGKSFIISFSKLTITLSLDNKLIF